MTESSVESVCSHYVHHCKLKTMCCNKIFDCHRCHNSAYEYAADHHVCTSFQIKIICKLCDTEQEIAKNCVSCNVQFGNYFCEKCCLYDDTDKQQYHCDKCGLCRVGLGSFSHCDVCGCCMNNSHICSKDLLKNNCPICTEDLFTSQDQPNRLNCGHFMHKTCLESYIKTNYKCPICFKSMCDMTSMFSQLTEEIENTPMPEEYSDMIVKIMCNDCLKESSVKFHIIGMKCSECDSYNTKRI